jgi:tetratricopeptide (TPR) repeat protein
MLIRIFHLFLIAACCQSTSLLAQSNTVSACDIPSKNCLLWVIEELRDVKPNTMPWYNLKLMQLDSLITIKEFKVLKQELSEFNDNLKLPPMFSLYLNIYKAKLDIIEGHEGQAIVVLALSLEKLQQLNQSFYSPMRMINIANLMQSLKQYDQSLVLLERIETDFENSRDTYLKLELYGNLGHVHRHLEDYDNALTYYKKSLQFAVELGGEQQIATLYDHVGRMYKATNQTELAELSYLNALTHAEKDARDSTILQAKINLAFFYLQQLELEKAQMLTKEIDVSKIEPHQQQKWIAIKTAIATYQ